MNFFIFLIMLLIGCQPTNTVVGKRTSASSGSGTGAIPTGLQQLRIVTENHQPLSGSQTPLSIGSALALNAALFDSKSQWISDTPVRWTAKFVDGTTSADLNCLGELKSACTFTPTRPGTYYIEVLLLERDSTVVSYTDATHPIVVSAPLTPATLTVVSGHQQVAVVNTTLTQPVVFRVLDVFSRPVPGAQIQVTVVSGGGQILSPLPLTTDALGQAQVSVSIGTLAGTLNHQLSAEVVASSPLLSTTFAASGFPANAHHLVWSTPPAATFAQLPFATQPVLVLKDQFNNNVSTLDTLTASVTTGSSALTGNLVVSVIGGVGAYSDLAFANAESNVTLRFTTSGGITLDSSPLNFIVPAGVGTITPNDVTFERTITNVGGTLGRTSSNIVTVAGITESIGVVVSGSGNPRVRINGQGEVASQSSVAPNSTLQLVADPPSTSGDISIVTLVMGGRTETWEIRYNDPTRVAYAFVTTATFSGNIGGGTPDAQCQTLANGAGFGGSWSAIITTVNQNIKARLPSDWGQLKRLDGALIATSWDDLWDGSLLNAINITETLTTHNNPVWTGVSNAITGAPHFRDCVNWASTSAMENGQVGDSSSLSSTWITHNLEGCPVGTGKALYCISHPSSVTDDSPMPFALNEVVVYAATPRPTSNPVTVTQINKTVTASVSSNGGGQAKIRVNNGPEVLSSTVYNGDQVVVTMDPPTTAGSVYTATLTIGNLSADWRVKLANSTNQAMIFVTSSTYNGADLGSLTNAQIECQTIADNKDLGGQWTALLTNTVSGPLQNFIPWNWGQLKRLDGAVVATSWSDLWDGNIQNPININENRTTTNLPVWTGALDFTGVNGTDSLQNNCQGWTTESTSRSARYGFSNVTTNSWLSASSIGCQNYHALYCISDPSGAADTTPSAVNFLKEVSYTLGARTSSHIVTISGITQDISVSVTGATGNPKLRINGGSEVASGTVSWGDTMQLVMDAPSSYGQSYLATVTLGSLLTDWTLVAADSSQKSRIFVSENTYTAGGLNGILGADVICNQEATNAGFTTGTWKALLSDSSTNARDHIPANWGTLTRMDGSTVVANSWSDLWDGTLQNAVLLGPNQTSVISNKIITFSQSNGVKYSSQMDSKNCMDWTSLSATSIPYSAGNSSSNSSLWVSNNIATTLNCGHSWGYNLYCIEDQPAGDDTTPSSFSFDYSIFQATSTRIQSNSPTILGISGAGVVVSLNGSQGNPAFKINGGSELTTGTIYNGQTLTLMMDSPASYNQSHKVEVKVGSGSWVPWRIWTGDTSSGVKKRVFITSATYNGNLGGANGADTICQTVAANNSNLNGYTWKAILSADSLSETSWAINRIGYDWAELWSFNADGSFKNRLFTGANIWNGIVPENAFDLDEMGSVVTTNLSAITNTNSSGRGVSSGNNSCIGFTSNITYDVTSGLINGPLWVNGSTGHCSLNNNRIYCIQQ